MIASNEHAIEQPLTDATELMMTAGDLARAMRISLRQIRYLKARGLLPEPIMVGRSERWCSSEVTKWILAHCPDGETWKRRAESVRIGG